MPTHEAALIQEARRLTRLQAKRTRLRRELKDVEAEIKLARKNLRALAAPKGGENFPPIRGFDGE